MYIYMYVGCVQVLDHWAVVPGDPLNTSSLRPLTLVASGFNTLVA
jgi:hypothetical protein